MKTTVLFFLLSAQAAHAGNELGNGGDLVAQEFIAAGRKLVQELKAKPDPRIPDVDKLAEAVETVKVSTAETLTLHGNEVDAINFPNERHIDVSRSRWRDYGSGKRASLVLHEYLGVLNVDDKQYEISGSYADAFAAPEEKPKNFEFGLSSSYGLGFSDQSSGRPGLGIFFGYKLNQKSTLGLKLDSRRHGSRAYRADYTEIALTYKYWLGSGRKWNPYLLAGAGYVRRTLTEFSAEPGWAETRRTLPSSGDLTLQIGGGYRYALFKDVGLDFGLNLHSLNSVSSPFSLDEKFLVGRVGVDLAF